MVCTSILFILFVASLGIKKLLIIALVCLLGCSSRNMSIFPRIKLDDTCYNYAFVFGWGCYTQGRI